MTGRSVALLAFLLLGAAAARAEPPTGDYAVDVAQPEIFLPVGVVEEACSSPQEVTLCVEDITGTVIPIPPVPIVLPVTSASGGITGNVAGSVAGDLVAASFPGETFGSLRGPVSRPRARLRMELGGLVNFGGIPVNGSARVDLRCRAGETTDTLACRGRTRFCAFEFGRRLGCLSESLDLELEQQGGPWQLRLVDLVTSEDGAVSGTAEVELSTTPPRILTYAVIGKYNAGKDTSTLRLTGGSTSAGSQLKLGNVVLEAGAATRGKVVFRIVGLTGKVDLSELEGQGE